MLKNILFSHSPIPQHLTPPLFFTPFPPQNRLPSRSEAFSALFYAFCLLFIEYLKLILMQVTAKYINFAVCRYINNNDMDIFDTITADIKKAMLAKDKVRLEALRGIKKEFIEAKTAKGSDGTLTNETATKVLVKMAKQRRESARIYEEQNRPELAETELAECAVIEEYLPKQLSDEELTAELKKIIEQVGATSAKEMGKVMGVASKALAGRAEGRAISAKVKELLA
jgi:hypothetical protein